MTASIRAEGLMQRNDLLRGRNDQVYLVAAARAKPILAKAGVLEPETSPATILRNGERSHAFLYNEDGIRPKRKDHKRSSRDANWIKQNQYDAICAYVNMSDKSLARFVVDITNAWVPDTKPPRRHSVAIPFYMRFEDVVWIAKAATGTQEESTRD
jgi:hypothetical protein